MGKENSPNDSSCFITIFVFIAFVIFLIWLAYVPEAETSKAQSLGTLFTGLAFSAMVGTLLLQRQDLKDTRIELKRTADANSESVLLAQKNLKAQFLLFKINQNKEEYERTKTLHRTTILELLFIKETLRVYYQKHSDLFKENFTSSNNPNTEILEFILSETRLLDSKITEMKEKIEKVYARYPAYAITSVFTSDYCKYFQEKNRQIIIFLDFKKNNTPINNLEVNVIPQPIELTYHDIDKKIEEYIKEYEAYKESLFAQIKRYKSDEAELKELLTLPTPTPAPSCQYGRRGC